MRDRLIELLKQKSCAYVPCDRECGECRNVEMYDDAIESIADHLLANGVIVPPCKVGDEVFQVGTYLDCDIDGYSVCDEYAKDEDIACGYCRHNVVKKYVKTSIYKHGMFEEIGKTVFLTKEEAERALKEREQSGC